MEVGPGGDVVHHSSTSVQVAPLPLNPCLQVQATLPFVSRQVASVAHLGRLARPTSLIQRIASTPERRRFVDPSQGGW